MRVFDWEDGFTPYSAVLDGDTLTEYAGEVVERRSTLTRRPEYDGVPECADSTMSDDFSAGDVAGVDVVWIDRQGFTLTALPSGDFDCCAYGDGHGHAVTVGQKFTRDGATFRVMREYMPGMFECRSDRGDVVITAAEIRAYAGAL